MPGCPLPERQPESDYCTQSKARMRPSRGVLMPSMSLLAGVSLAVSMTVSLHAQSRSVSKSSPAKQPALRALGVLEWTGEAGKPSASRLIPVAIFTGERYQDASLYLARPEPLAVQPDTEYELLQAGTPKGRFDIVSAGHVEDSWFGYGIWKPLIAIRPPKLAVSKTLPEMVKDVNSDRPHFSHGDPNSTSPDNSASSAKTTN